MIRKLYFLRVLSLFLLGIPAMGQTVELNVSTPGTLNTMLTDAEWDTVKSLKVTGSINGRDIDFIHSLAGGKSVRFRRRETLEELSLVLHSIKSVQETFFEYETFLNNDGSIEVVSEDNDLGCILSGCHTLKSVIMDWDFVSDLKPYMFAGCSSLKNIVLPNTGVETIEYCVFAECTGLTDVNFLPKSVKTIRHKVFYGCTALTNIVIPSSVKDIDHDAFNGCPALTNINVERGNLAYASIDGVLLDKDGVLRQYPIGRKGPFAIPPYATSIGGEAFYGCTGLTSVSIPSSVELIWSSAFEGCTGLTSVSIPSSVRVIGGRAFKGCTSLTSVSIPSSVKHIDDDTFSGCTGLTSVPIPSSVTRIGHRAFYNCTGLTSFSIPSSVTNIGYNVFEGCTGLTSVSIPSSVMYINKDTFKGCTGLTSVSIPSSVRSIGSKAFWGCTGLKKVYCFSETEPLVPSDGFSESIYEDCILYVPKGSYFTYLVSAWGAFKNIQEMDLTGIGGLEINEEAGGDTYYSVDGKPQSTLKGIGIVRKKNGKTYKIWKK